MYYDDVSAKDLEGWTYKSLMEALSNLKGFSSETGYLAHADRVTIEVTTNLLYEIKESCEAFFNTKCGCEVCHGMREASGDILGILKVDLENKPLSYEEGEYNE